jgi:hypothetical protein
MYKPNELDAALWTHETFHQALCAADKCSGEWEGVMRAAYKWRKDLLRRKVDQWVRGKACFSRGKVRFGRSIGIQLTYRQSMDAYYIRGWRGHV